MRREYSYRRRPAGELNGPDGTTILCDRRLDSIATAPQRGSLWGIEGFGSLLGHGERIGAYLSASDSPACAGLARVLSVSCDDSCYLRPAGVTVAGGSQSSGWR